MLSVKLILLENIVFQSEKLNAKSGTLSSVTKSPLLHNLVSFITVHNIGDTYICQYLYMSWVLLGMFTIDERRLHNGLITCM